MNDEKRSAAGLTAEQVATVQARRQHIHDMARCDGCGATRKECDRVREETRRTDPTTPPWFGCCARGVYADRPCHHADSANALHDLTTEIMNGHVRTVAEVDPPPVLGPARVSLAWLLDQDEWWYPKGRPPVRIAHMDKPWRLNTLRMLERKAVGIKFDIGMRYMHDAPDDVWGSWERESPLEHLHEYPLIKALRRGLPGRPDKLAALEARAKHWSTCPMRLAHPGRLDRCACITDDNGRTVGATNDPATVTA